MTNERVIPPTCPRCHNNIAVMGYNNHCDKSPTCPWITCACTAVIDTRKPGRWMEARR